MPTLETLVTLADAAHRDAVTAMDTAEEIANIVGMDSAIVRAAKAAGNAAVKLADLLAAEYHTAAETAEAQVRQVA